MKPVIINMYGGPGCGKSTLAARIFSEMKCEGINCELVTEYAKDLVWREMHKVKQDEIYIFAKQQHKLKMISPNVDYIITDSPLLLPIIYDTTGNTKFYDLVLHEYNSYNNVNFLLRRFKEYNPAGRNQTEVEAKSLDTLIEHTLNIYHIPYIYVSDPADTHWDDLRYVV